MAVYRCLYCPTKQARPFAKEHVIPRGFGVFRPEMVLRSVCSACNGYFGKEIDWFLNRDSAAALMRSRLQPNLASTAGSLKSKRIRITVNESGPWFGALVYVRPDLKTGALETELIPQASFRKKDTERRVWFTISDLKLKKADDLAEFRNETETQIIGPSLKACEHVRKRIEALGIRFTEQGRLDDPITNSGQISTSVLCTVDSVILRGIAKIAFEYLAYMHGADFALREDFDSIRGFIRHGHNADSTPVRLRRGRILAGETSAIRCTRGHLLTIEWPALGYDIMARVSLFNDAVYEVTLCRRFTGIWRDIHAGHHFDIESGAATQLQTVSAALLI